MRSEGIRRPTASGTMKTVIYFFLFHEVQSRVVVHTYLTGSGTQQESLSMRTLILISFELLWVQVTAPKNK